jgi:hypothetical protein
MRIYDLAVAYRICSQLSKAGSAFGNDKYRLSEICLKSFKESLADLRAKVWVLLDNCPPQYTRLFQKYVPAEDLVLVHLNDAGNRATFARQVEILLSQEDAEIVYFAEDDYLYLPGQFPSMIKFIQANHDVHFISPYDHLDCYNLDLHRGPKSLRIFDDRHWRTAASTCLTFLTNRQTLRGARYALQTYSHSNHDCSMWLSLSKESVFSASKLVKCLLSKDPRGQASLMAKAWLHGWRQILFGRKWNIWIPIPAMATHLDANALSPAVDWTSLIKQKTEILNSDQLHSADAHATRVNGTGAVQHTKFAPINPA